MTSGDTLPAFSGRVPTPLSRGNDTILQWEHFVSLVENLRFSFTPHPSLIEKTCISPVSYEKTIADWGSFKPSWVSL